MYFIDFKIPVYPQIYLDYSYFNDDKYVINLWVDEEPASLNKSYFKLVDLNGEDIKLDDGNNLEIEYIEYSDGIINLIIDGESLQNLESKVLLEVSSDLVCKDHNKPFAAKLVYYDPNGKAHRIVACYDKNNLEIEWIDHPYFLMPDRNIIEGNIIEGNIIEDGYSLIKIDIGEWGLRTRDNENLSDYFKVVSYIDELGEFQPTGASVTAEYKPYDEEEECYKNLIILQVNGELAEGDLILVRGSLTNVWGYSLIQWIYDFRKPLELDNDFPYLKLCYEDEYYWSYIDWFDPMP